MYDKEEAVIGKALNKGDLAIKFIMPQDMDYATEKQKEHISDYLLIDYHHVYSNDNNNVNMNYAYTNITAITRMTAQTRTSSATIIRH